MKMRLGFFVSVVALGGLEVSGQCSYSLNGKTYDLSAIGGQDYAATNTGYDGYDYKISFCGNYCSCTKNYYPQQVMVEQNDDTGCVANLADWDSNVQPTTLDPNFQADGLSFTFTNGESCAGGTRTIQINFVCDSQLQGLIQGQETIMCQYSFEFHTSAACAGSGPPGPVPVPTLYPSPTPAPFPGGPTASPTQPAPSKAGGLGGGDLFLVLLFCGFGLYCFGGVAYNMYSKKTSVRESIPQSGFWCAALPNYTKAGCLVTKEKITGLCAKKEGSSTGGDE